MPKDIVHWLVAQRSADALGGAPGAEVYGPAIHERWPCLLLAAVLHDALYYLRVEAPESVRRLPNILHGQHGEDTHSLLRLQLAHVASAPDAQQRDSRIAALVGLASHIQADALMHPAIYHLTGRYDDPDPQQRTKAVQRHRLMETVMDIAACHGRALVKRHSLAWLLEQCGGANATALAAIFPLDGLAAAHGMTSPALGQGLAASFSLFASLQAWYKSDFASGALYALRGLLPNAAKELAALFYAPQLEAEAGAVAKPLSYAHPVTGAAGVFVLIQAIEAAAQATTALCLEFAPALAGHGNAPQSVGSSLVTGLPGVGADSMTHFADPALFASF
jgi:hypothetical protein